MRRNLFSHIHGIDIYINTHTHIYIYKVINHFAKHAN